MNHPNPPNCQYANKLFPNLHPCNYEGHCEYKKEFRGMNRPRTYCWYDKRINQAVLDFQREKSFLERKLDGEEGHEK